jgi:hypothetical protein
MIEAAPLPITAPTAGNSDADKRYLLWRFAKWCRSLKFIAPASWSQERKDHAYGVAGDYAESQERQIAEVALKSELGMAALLWISTMRICDMVDRANPVLPNVSRAEHRRLVLSIAQHHPDLAQLAGVTHAEISGNSPHDGRPLAAA